MIDFETNERLNACEHYIDELKSEILRLKLEDGIEEPIVTLEILLKNREWKQYTAVLWSLGCHYGSASLNHKDFPTAKVFQRVKEGLIAMRDKHGVYFKIAIDRKCYV